MSVEALLIWLLVGAVAGWLAGLVVRGLPAVGDSAAPPLFAAYERAARVKSQRILMEKIGTRKQDDILILDIRAEKFFNVGAARRIGLFLDVYNLTNSDAQQNITWNAGTAFELPSSIVPPTIARFGVKFDW